MAKSRFKAIANLVVEVILIINMVLAATGRTPLPVDEQGVMEVVYGLLTGLQTLRVWWYNQNMTVEAETCSHDILTEKTHLSCLLDSNLKTINSDRILSTYIEVTF